MKLKGIKVCDFTEEEVKNLYSHSLTSQESEETQRRVSSYLEKNPNDLTALIFATQIFEDVFLRHHYSTQVFELAKKTKDFSAYSSAIYVALSNNRKDVATTFYKLTKDKFPIRARIMNFLFNFYFSKLK